MPYELFWHGDVTLVIAYRKAHELQNEQRNQEMWVQGIYVFRAIKSIAENVIYGISGGKGSKPSTYPEEPIALSERAQAEMVERNKKRTMAWVKDGQR